MYQAEPGSEHGHATVPLELLSITLSPHTIQLPRVSKYIPILILPSLIVESGRKKLKQLESEIQRLTRIRHPNLLAVLAVKLTTPKSNDSPHLLVLTEQRPAVTLQDVLEDCDWLREDRASVYCGYHKYETTRIHACDITGLLRTNSFWTSHIA